MKDPRQIDMFSHQLDLLAQPAPAAAPRYGMPPSVLAAHDRAYSDEVKAELLAVYAAKPGEFLDTPAIRHVIKKHDIGTWFGHVLHSLARDGKLESKDIYMGSDHPSKPNYQGYYTVYRIAEAKQ